MNILKEFAKIFIRSKLEDEKRKLKDKLQKQIITTTSTSVVARNVGILIRRLYEYIKKIKT